MDQSLELGQGAEIAEKPLDIVLACAGSGRSGELVEPGTAVEDMRGL